MSTIARWYELGRYSYSYEYGRHFVNAYSTSVPYEYVTTVLVSRTSTYYSYCTSTYSTVQYYRTRYSTQYPVPATYQGVGTPCTYYGTYHVLPNANHLRVLVLQKLLKLLLQYRTTVHITVRVPATVLYEYSYRTCLTCIRVQYRTVPYGSVQILYSYSTSTVLVLYCAVLYCTARIVHLPRTVRYLS